MIDRNKFAMTYGDDLLFLDPPESFDKCILGVVHRCGFEFVVCYDQQMVIEELMLGGMDHEEAEEWFSFNTAGAYMGPKTPMFLERPITDEG